MDRPSFVHIPRAGFAAFAAVLSTDPWARVDASPYEASAKSFRSAPILVTVKLRLERCVDALLQTMAGTGKSHEARIVEQYQKQLSALLDTAARSNDPAKRDAAQRLRELLFGVGEEQTTPSSRGEMDFARIQQSLVDHGQAEADVALLGLDPLLSEIAAIPDSLAGTSTTSPLHGQKANAVEACMDAFGWAAETLAWLVKNARNGSERELANALLVSLVDLATRYAIFPPAARLNDPPLPTVH